MTQFQFIWGSVNKWFIWKLCVKAKWQFFLPHIYSFNSFNYQLKRCVNQQNYTWLFSKIMRINRFIFWEVNVYYDSIYIFFFPDYSNFIPVTEIINHIRHLSSSAQFWSSIKLCCIYQFYHSKCTYFVFYSFLRKLDIIYFYQSCTLKPVYIF